MDHKDVSSEEWFASLLRQWQESADRARQRKGQLVRYHPPPDLLISRFMANLLASSTGFQSKKNTIATSQLPPAYAPCVCPSSELQPIAISDMRLETHHRGKGTLVRVLTPPQRMTSVMAIVEDEQGTALLLQLYYQPDEPTVPVREILQRGDVFLVKEPFFKCATDGAYTLRVDHVSDIVRLDNTDKRIPSKWRMQLLMPKQGSKSIRMEGNAAVKEERWAEAQRL